MMTREEILNLIAGSALDVLVSEKVMGWHKVDMKSKNNGWFWSDGKKHIAWDLFSPSTDISAAWKVVEKVTNEYRVALYKIPSGIWSCKFSDHPPILEESATLAICKAALISVIERNDEEK